MRVYPKSIAAALVATVAAPGFAAAQDAMTTVALNMRAGPSTQFPVVEVVPDSGEVDIHGCVRGYRWCDVSWRGARGWVYADYLQYYYDGRYVPVADWGERADLPIVVFAVDSYWNSHYRNRRWYSERSRWRSAWRNHDWRDVRRRHRADRHDGRRDRQARGDRREERAERRGDRREERAERRRDRRADRGENRRDRRVERRENRAERRGRRMEQRQDRRESRSEQRGRRMERRQQRQESRNQGRDRSAARGGAERSARSFAGGNRRGRAND